MASNQANGRIRTHRLAVGVLIVASLLPGARAHAQTPATRHVLYLNSYQPGYAWGDDLLRGIVRVLEAEPYPVELWVEHMDSRRFPKPEYESRLEHQLQTKYAGRRFDLIVSADDAALEYLLPRHHTQYPGVPVVFLGLNNWSLADTVDRQLVTGLREVLRTEHFVELALTLRPGTLHFVIVAGASPTSAAQVQAYRAIAAKRPALTFTFLDSADRTLEEILDVLQTVPPEAAVLTTAFTRDHTGRYFPRDEAVRRIVDASGAPVYSPAISEVGQGLVAGSENVGIPHGTRAARLVRAVLAGTPPGDLPIDTDDQARVLIDYAQVRRWGIDPRRLPPTALVLNQPSSFYQAHKYLVWSALLFIVGQTVVIGALVVNVTRRRRAEGALALQAAQLSESNADLERLNLALRTEIDERHRAEERLRQSQKIEAVGRLAGGIAHDFNNLLTIIGSYAEIAIEALPPSDPVRGCVMEVQHASQRAARLTHQLLAFSRKQVLVPTVVAIDDIIRGVEPMLRRLIGEDIIVLFELCEPSPRILVDVGQIEQVVVNLAINARDAMPDGGRLIIETHVREFDETAVEARPDMTSGRYAELAVTDSGQGMDAETRAKIFEPFFSTKGVRGTGLGLSTVYGIVKQSGGWIWVYSEQGIGTTFKIYFPVSEAQETTTSSLSQSRARRPATETVLLVEDQQEVRVLAARLLRALGYTVLEAPSSEEALERARQHEGPIHLLLTDVVMTGLSGRQLAEHLLRDRPNTRVLYMSGYTDNVIVHRGVLDADMAFLQKPFTPDTLAQRVSAVLDAKGAV